MNNTIAMRPAVQNKFQPEPIMDIDRWLAHFQQNKQNRPEPDWHSPVSMEPGVIRKLVHSLEQFQLGDGGGPASLIAWNANDFRDDGKGTRELVDLWFNEEKEHSRLLGGAVARFGGKRITSHWSFSAFCWCRHWFGVRFELTVLLLTEIVSTGYYRLMRRHCGDPALYAMCGLILRDEAGHVAFHRDRMARAVRRGKTIFGNRWETTFRLLGLAAGTMLWVNHRSALIALGASDIEFYQEIWLELSRFVRRLRRDSAIGRPMTQPCLEVAAYPQIRHAH